MLGAMTTSILLFTRDNTGKQQNVILHMNENSTPLLYFAAVVMLLVEEINQ
jgi:flagellar biosynthesis regulator FlbT